MYIYIYIILLNTEIISLDLVIDIQILQCIVKNSVQLNSSEIVIIKII